MAKKYTKKQPWGTISKHIQLFEMFRELYKIGELIQKQIIDIYVCSYMFVYMYVAVYIYIYMNEFAYVCGCLYACMYVALCMYVCMYVCSLLYACRQVSMKCR